MERNLRVRRIIFIIATVKYKVKKSLLVIPFLLLAAVTAFGQFIYPPDLQCVENDNVNSNVVLSWTNPTNPCGAFTNYTIYVANNPAGPFAPLTTITTATQTTYTDLGRLGIGPTWYYYMVTNANCPGATQLSSDTVNNLNPAIPEIINVTVTPGGDVIINWAPSTSPQTHGYVIYYFLPSNQNAIPLDTVYGLNTTTYTDVLADPTTQILDYTVSAFDSCNNSSAFNEDWHNTMYLTGGIATCDNRVAMQWNRYINWPQGVKEYQIWVTTNGGPPTLAATVDSGTVTYNYTGFTDGDSLYIIVKAISAADTNVTSNSNELALEATVVQIPSYLYVTNATITANNHISFTWMIDTTSELIYYKVDNSVNQVSFDPVIQIPAPDPLNWLETHIDSNNVFPENNPYWYRVTAFDSCNHLFVSDSVKTISLKGELFDYYVAHLNWNSFEIPYGTVIGQNLYRDFGNGPQLIAAFGPDVNEYSDSLQDFLSERGIFCYRIEAEYVLNLPNGYNANLSSFSNEQCIIHRPIIYIPNAFAPNGLNNVFKPTIIYGEPKAYTMSIFNRWGAQIFTTNDPTAGWDGTEGGKPSQMGAYAYLIQFNANDGVKVERKGMVLLVK